MWSGNVAVGSGNVAVWSGNVAVANRSAKKCCSFGKPIFRAKGRNLTTPSSVPIGCTCSELLACGIDFGIIPGVFGWSLISGWKEKTQAALCVATSSTNTNHIWNRL